MSSPVALKEIHEVPTQAVLEQPDRWLESEAPWIARNLVAEWPLVRASQNGDHAFLSYLLRFYSGHKVAAFLGEPNIKGRFFYNSDLSGFNFTQLDTSLQQLSEKLEELSTVDDAPALYMGSTNLDHWLPGLSGENTLPLSLSDPLASLWLGNRSTVAAHFDYPANIACCVAGRRQFTLFPPEQTENLYIGPWDLTPAGQPVSLVDIKEPDLAQFPLFAEALESASFAELAPGDAIYIPSLWWHQVEALSAVNGLVNFWWTQQPPVFGAPMDAFSHALLSLKQLPPAQRAAWRALFDYYVFSEDASDRSYWPKSREDRTSDMDDALARKLRAELTNNLRR